MTTTWTLADHFECPWDAEHFELGDQYHSTDDGRTWQRGPAPERPALDPVTGQPWPEYPSVRVTHVDREQGIITVGEQQ